MPPLWGLAYFPGLNQIVDGTADCTVGIMPATATLTIAPQANFVAQVGTLSFFDGQTRIDWRDARLDTNSFERNSSGLVWRLAIHDRRWKWTSTGGGGIILRGINLRNDDGTLLTVTEKSPQDAAKLCLDAMGETDYDVSVLPNDERPELIWDGALPAEALQQLCEQLGCYVVLGLDNKVRICKVGEGAQLPETPDIMTNSLSLTIPGIPDRIAVVCAPDRFQVDLELEAVGIENDGKGTLKLIDELSYKPAAGWSATDIGFDDVEEQHGIKAYNLAVKSVYRYYRVKFPIQVKGYIDTKGNANATITRPWQVRLEDTQVEFLDEDMGLPEEQRRCKPLQVFGKYFEENDGRDENNTDKDVKPYQDNPALPSEPDEDGEIEHYTWSLGHVGQSVPTEHFVVFNKPLYKNTFLTDIWMHTSADLILRCACTILDEHWHSPVRAYFWRDTGANLGTPTRHEVFNDLQVWHYFDYDTKTTKDNTAEIQQGANYYIDGLIQEYQATVPHTILYGGLKRVELDGAIRHIHYKIGKAGCTTTISRHDEQLNHIQPLSYRRLMSKITASVKKTQGRKPTLRSHKRGSEMMR